MLSSEQKKRRGASRRIGAKPLIDSVNPTSQKEAFGKGENFHIPKSGFTDLRGSEAAQ